MKNKKKLIYILFISELNVCKIGISENVERRIKQLQTGCPYKIDVVKTFNSPISSKIEKVIHRSYTSNKVDENEYNLMGEWFNIPVTEVLSFENKCREIEDRINYLKSSGNPFV